MIVGVVVSNLLYLLGAVVVAVIGALVVVLRHRKPKSVEANVASFHRGLRALAPDQPAVPSGSGPSWGGAHRPAAATPTFPRPADRSPAAGGGLDEAGEPAAGHAPDDPAGPAAEADHEPEGDAGVPPADEGVDAVGDPEGGAEPEGAEAATASGGDRVHVTTRKRRPSSGSNPRANHESEVPTEEAGTG
jgi:hypothetical protein